MRLPGRVAARSGGSAKKEKAAPAKNKEQPKPEKKAAVPKPPKKEEPKKQQKVEQPPQPAQEKVKKEVFLQPQDDGRKVGTSSRSRKRREPVWIPVNDQPIVTRPQSYFIEPPKAEPEAEKPPKKKKRRRHKPSQKSKTSGGTQ